MLKCHIAAIGEKKSPGVSASIGGENAGDQIRRDRRIKSPGVSPALAWKLLLRANVN